MGRWIQKLLMHHDAQVDAEHGIDALEDQLRRRLPQKPAFSPATNERHAQMTAALAKEGELEEVRRDIADTEEQLRHLPSPGLLSVGILVLLLAEFLGASLLLAGLGMSGIERLILSAALTAGLVFLTGRVVEAAPSKEQEAGPSSPPFWLLIGLYVIVVIALAVARGASVDADVEGGGVVRAAFSLVLLVIAIGPAWLVERWMRDRRLPAALRNRLAALKGREKELARVVRRAEVFVASLSEEAASFEKAAEQLGAEYRLAHRRERSAVPEVLPSGRRRKS